MKSRHLICLTRSGKTFHVEPDRPESLLEALEANQLQTEYQCREGYCGSCRVRILNGEVCYFKPPLAWLEQQEILPCCCRAVSDLELDL
jgi:ferredoxin